MGNIMKFRLGLGVLNKILDQGKVELMEDTGDWLNLLVKNT